jgi:hypothetical protein
MIVRQSMCALCVVGILCVGPVLGQAHPLMRAEINVKDSKGGQSLIYIKKNNERKKETRARGGTEDRGSKASRKRWVPGPWGSDCSTWTFGCQD